eukprot:COSAG01_NODE_3760_length_5722_cov_5.035390_7_plen_111_part_00
MGEGPAQRGGGGGVGVSGRAGQGGHGGVIWGGTGGEPVHGPGGNADEPLLQLARGRRPQLKLRYAFDRTCHTVEGGAPAEEVSRAFPSWNRNILTEIYLGHACSCQEIEG